MAQKRQVVQMQLLLDGTQAENAVKTLASSLEELRNKRKRLLEEGHGEGSKLLKGVDAEIKTVNTLLTQTRKMYIDVENGMRELANNAVLYSERALKSYKRYATNRAAGLGNDKASQAERKKILDFLHMIDEELQRRSVALHASHEAVRRMDADTVASNRRLVQELEAQIPTLEKRSAAQRRMMADYLKARSVVERGSGQMNYDLAGRLSTGSRNKGDLQQLREAGRYLDDLRAKWGQFMSSAQADTLERRIKGVADRTLELARAVAQDPTKASFADMNTAMQVLDARMKTLNPNIKAQKPLLAALRPEYDQLRQAVQDWGRTAVTVADGQAALAKAEQLMKGGAQASATEVRRLMETLLLAKDAEGQTVGGVQQINTAYKQLQATLQATSATPLRALTEVLNDLRGASSLNDLQRLRTELQAVFGSLTNPAEQQRARQELDQLAQRIQDFGKVAAQPMAGHEAMQRYADAQRVLSQGSSASAAAIRKVAEEMKAAQQAAGLTVKQTQLLAAAEREATELLRGKEVVTMSQANAMQVLTAAEGMLADVQARDAAEVRKYIDLLTQAQKAEGVSVANAQRMATAQRQLKAALTETVKTYMTEAEILRVIGQGEQAQVTDINRAIEALQYYQKAQGTTAAQARAYAQQIETLRERTRAASEASRGLAYDQDHINKTMKNLRSTPIADLEKAAKMLEERMKTLDRKSKDFSQTSKRYREVKMELDSVRNGTDKLSQAINKTTDFFTRGANKVLSYIGVFGGFYMIRNKVMEAFSANLKYDDSLSNIRKTTQMTSEAVAQLSENIKRLDTRTSLDEVTNLAYAAGRLGVKGASDVMGFVRAADQINIALGEQLNGAESVEQLMKIAELMGTNRELGLEQALLKTGSAINELTMNSTATAQPIVDFMRRTAGVATQAGMTTAELTGLAGAINALGQNVEMSATSISKMMVQISSNSRVVAKALQMDAEETQRFFNDITTGHMADALLTVLQKAREAGGLSHLGTIVKDLGSEGQRVVQTVATLATNYEKVERMIRMSNDAFREGVSVTNEYNLKNSNTAALWERIKNEVSKIFISTDVIEWLRRLLIEMQDLPVALKNIASSFSWLRDIAGAFVSVLTRATFIVEAFLQALAARTVLIWGKGLVVAINNMFEFVKATVAGTRATEGLTAAQRRLNAQAKSNLFLFLATAVLTLYHALTDAARAAREFDKEVLAGLQRAKEQAAAEKVVIDDLLTSLKDAQVGTLERAGIIATLNEKYGDYLGNLLTEAMSYEEIAAAMQAVNAQMERKAILDAQAETETNIRSSYQDKLGLAREETIEALMKLRSKDSGDTIDKTTAAQIFESMANNPTQVLREILDGSGQIKSYLNAGAEQKFLKYFSDRGLAGGQYNEDFYSATNKLNEYMNLLVKRDREIARNQEIGDFDLRNTSKKADEFYAPQAARLFEAIREGVTIKSTLTDTHATRDQEVVYARQRDAMKQEARIEAIEQMKQYVAIQKQHLANYESINSVRALQVKAGNGVALTEAEQAIIQQYKVEEAALANTRARLKVFELGALEQKNGDGAGRGSKAMTAVKDDYKNIIAKIEEFYSAQEQYYKEQFLDGQMTRVGYKQAVEANKALLNETLSHARGRIVGDEQLNVWNDAVDVMRVTASDTGAGLDTLRRIEETGDVRDIGTRAVIAASATDATPEDTAFLSGIRKEGQVNRTAAIEIMRKQMEEVSKALLEYNAAGQITEQFQDIFENLGIMVADFGKLNGESLEVVEQDIMRAYRDIGSQALKFDVATDEGVASFRAALAERMKESGRAVIDIAAMNDEQVRLLYYKAYEYAESYQEALTKAADRNMKIWEKMYNLTGVAKKLSDLRTLMDAMSKESSNLEQYGLSRRMALMQTAAAREIDVTEAESKYAFRKNKAAESRAAADAASARGDANADDLMAQAEADEQAVAASYEKVQSAIEALTEAQRALRDETLGWVRDMEAAFDRFAESIVPFRSFFEDKGSFASNVFGTKEERQKAFGSFVDDVKKATRDAIMEWVKMRVSRMVQSKLMTTQEKLEHKKQEIEQESHEVTMQGIEAASGATKVTIKQGTDAIMKAARAEDAADEIESEAQTVTGVAAGEGAKGIAKAFAQLGPIGGAVAAALITAVIGAAVTAAMNMLGHKNKGKTQQNANLKVTSGMLTYDTGNVQSVAAPVRTLAGGMMPVMGDDGRVYMVPPTDGAPLGTGMVTRPTLTRVGGMPALVGERGPEMVIGRETTAAMMMSRPDLLRAIMEFDANRSRGFARTFDSGNLRAILPDAATENARSEVGEEVSAALVGVNATMRDVSTINAELLRQLRHGIRATINKYGSGGLVEEVASGFVEARRLGDDKNVTRLFGSRRSS